LNSSGESAESQTDQDRSASNSSIFGIDWNALASNILAYNTTEMCTQAYVVGSGYVKETILVNRTCRCVQFDQAFNSTSISQQLASLIRPLIYGQIYYYPSNIPYENLIKQMNQTFESLDDLVKLLRQIQSAIQPTYQTFSTICNLTSNSSTLCEQLNEYTSSVYIFTLVTEFIACVEKNRFIAKSSETELVEDGQNNSLTNTFLAGIVFLNDISNNDTLPKHLQYKIRMSLDYVDNTFSTQDR